MQYLLNRQPKRSANKISKYEHNMNKEIKANGKGVFQYGYKITLHA